MKQDEWDKTFLIMAQMVAERHSKDPRTKVGAVIAKESYPLSLGYNGIIRGVPDSKEILNDRELKLVYTEHAEKNAIFNASRNNIHISGASLYTTHEPCHECMRAIIQSGISRIVVLNNKEFTKSSWKDSINYGRSMTEYCGVPTIYYDL